jgi:hypothetical protein
MYSIQVGIVMSSDVEVRASRFSAGLTFFLEFILTPVHEPRPMYTYFTHQDGH